MERQRKLFIAKLEEMQELKPNVMGQKLLEDNNNAENVVIVVNVGRFERVSTKYKHWKRRKKKKRTGKTR